LFILGDAGMGKTSLLLMLKLMDLGGFWPKKFTSYLHKLNEFTLETISKIENKKSTILLLDALDEVWPLATKYKISKTSLALSFILNHRGISSVIPGIKSPEQSEMNIKDLISIDEEDLKLLHRLFEEKFDELVGKMV